MRDLPANLQTAYFDVDGTLTQSNIVEPLLYIKKRVMSPVKYRLWAALLPLRFMYWTILDKIDRERSTAAIYRQYKGIPVEKMSALCDPCYQEQYKKKMFPKALEALRSFREQGVRIVFVSGSLDIFLQPLAAESGAALIASRLETKDGVYTGKLAGTAVAGKRKADRISEHAHKHRLDLEHCAAFGNSVDDIPMLRSVKYPMAVNPDKGLLAFAQKKNWDTLNWS